MVIIGFGTDPWRAGLIQALAVMSSNPDNFKDLVDRGVSGVAFALEPLAVELRAYGEPTVAEWLLAIDPDIHAKISMRAHQIPGMLDKAICLAAVEIFGGIPRSLHRKRRVYSKHDG